MGHKWLAGRVSADFALSTATRGWACREPIGSATLEIDQRENYSCKGNHEQGDQKYRLFQFLECAWSHEAMPECNRC
jgi:hypothetical protein